MRTPGRVHLLPALLVALAAVIVISSCWPFDMDSNATTPGYKLFVGRTEGLRISFEYPASWTRRSAETHENFKSVILEGEQRSYVIVASDVNAAGGGKYADARELVQHRIDIDANGPDFLLLSRSQLPLGQVMAEETTYSVRSAGDYVAGTPKVNKFVFSRFLAADYKGRIYYVDFLVDVNRYGIGVRSGLEHLIASFRFLE